ncbi:F-box protein of unknown function [Batrachochytrium dendrobatidis]|nr:F-box protein of unknown function [Batrachochytrium dendrobatidis]
MFISLPLEIQGQIFKCLTVGDILILSNVCRGLRYLSLSYHVWMSSILVVGDNLLQPSPIIAFRNSSIRNNQHTKRPCYYIDQSTLEKFAPYLHYIQAFTSAPFHDIVDRTMAWSFVPNLLYVDLSGNNGITDKCIKALASNCKIIRSLNLSKCHGLSPKTVYIVSTELKFLENLDLSNTRCATTHSIVHLLSHCQHPLVNLSLESCHWIDWSILLASSKGIASHSQHLSKMNASRNILISGKTLIEFARLRAQHLLTLSMSQSCPNHASILPILSLDVCFCEDITEADAKIASEFSNSYLSVTHNALMKDTSAESIHNYLKLICGL